MKKLVSVLVFAVVFHQAQAGLKLLHDEKRSIFDIIPEGTHLQQNKKLSVKCYKYSSRNCFPGFEAGSKKPPVLFGLDRDENNLKQSSKDNLLKKQIRNLFKARNRKRPTFQSFDVLKKKLNSYIKIITTIINGLIRTII